jgi:hypothetical protein
MSDLKQRIEEWVQLKKQIGEIRKDVSVLAKREKELASFIKDTMKQNDVDDIKLNDKKVRLRTKESKGSITKDVIVKGLTSYFTGDAVKVEGAMKAIADSAPAKTTSSLSLLKNGSKQ